MPLLSRALSIFFELALSGSETQLKIQISRRKIADEKTSNLLITTNNVYTIWEKYSGTLLPNF